MFEELAHLLDVDVRDMCKGLTRRNVESLMAGYDEWWERRSAEGGFSAVSDDRAESSQTDAWQKRRESDPDFRGYDADARALAQERERAQINAVLSACRKRLFHRGEVPRVTPGRGRVETIGRSGGQGRTDEIGRLRAHHLFNEG